AAATPAAHHLSHHFSDTHEYSHRMPNRYSGLAQLPVITIGPSNLSDHSTLATPLASHFARKFNSIGKLSQKGTTRSLIRLFAIDSSFICPHRSQCVSMCAAAI